MISTTRTRVAAIGIALSALALAGCATGGTPGDTTSPTGGGDSTELAGTGWQRVDPGQLADGGTLNLPVDVTPLNFNTNQADSGTVDDATIAGLYMPSYINLAEDGSWTVNENYAESVELTSEDPQVVEVKLNPDAVWSDGTPMTVADFQTQWEAITSDDFSPNARNVYSDIESVEQGDDEYHLVITFGNTNADWVSILSVIYPTWVMDTPEHFETAWQNGPFAEDGETYVSGGPFIVTDYDQNGQVLTFGRNPEWWGDTAKLETVIFKTVSRDGLAQAFANNEIDAFNLYGSADALATAEGRGDAQIQRSAGTTIRHITLNGTSDVFADPVVRQAFAASLDRSTLSAAILSGVGAPSNELGNLIYLPGQNGYVDDTADTYLGDPDAARQMLTDEGYEFGADGVLLIDGEPATVRFVIPSDNRNSRNIAILTQQQAGLAGFDVQVDVVPSADFFAEYVNTDDKDFDATYFAWVGTPFPVSSSESIYYPADSGQNYSGITDETLGDDWDAANAELDPEARIELANAIDAKLIALYSTLPLFYEPYTWGVVNTLGNYGPSQFETPIWEHVGFTELPE